MEMKYAIWELEHSGKNLLIPTEEIEERTLVSNSILLDEIELTHEELKAWNKGVRLYENPIHSDSDLAVYLEEELGLENFELTTIEAPSYPPYKNQIAFDLESKEFFNLMDCETVKVYEWWDGSNFITEELSEADTEKIVEITDDYVDLDEMEGNNFVTEGLGLHQRLYKIISIDGELAKDKYLLNRWSEWQGDHETGEILTLDEVKVHLERLNRDVAKYMFELGKISGK